MRKGPKLALQASVGAGLVFVVGGAWRIFFYLRVGAVCCDYMIIQTLMFCYFCRNDDCELHYTH